MIKLRPRTMFENRISVNVFLNKLIRTYVITNNGTIVTEISTILKISAELPSKNLSVKSLVYKGKEPAPCSNAAQKKTVKRQNIVKTIILSRTIVVYLGILTSNNVINEINATRAKNNEFSIPKYEKLRILIPPILLNGSLIINISALTTKIKINKISNGEKGFNFSLFSFLTSNFLSYFSGTPPISPNNG